MHNYLISNSANSLYTCKKSPAIDCHAFKDRPVDRDRLVGQPWSKNFFEYFLLIFYFIMKVILFEMYINYLIFILFDESLKYIIKKFNVCFISVGNIVLICFTNHSMLNQIQRAAEKFWRGQSTNKK